MNRDEIKNMITLKDTMFVQISECRDEIADLKMAKTNKRAEAWSEAEGTAKQKEDEVKASVSDLDNQISVLESKIELYYNQTRTLDDKIELEYMPDD